MADVRRERNRKSISSPSVKRRRPNDNQNICVPGVQNNECVMPLLNIDTNSADKTLQEETSVKLEAVACDQDLGMHQSGVSSSISESGLFCQTDLTRIDIEKLLSDNEALQKENGSLKAVLLKCEEAIKSVSEECESLETDNVGLRAEVMDLRDKVKSLSLTEDSFKGNDSKVKFYTGLPTFTLLLHIFNFVGVKIDHTCRNALPKFSEFLVTMMRLRLGRFETDLAYRFGIAQSTVSSICEKWIRMMSARLSPFLIWPERDVLHKTMPQYFKDAFGLKIGVIIDCFEVFINRESSLKTRAETWSRYTTQ